MISAAGILLGLFSLACDALALLSGPRLDHKTVSGFDGNGDSLASHGFQFWRELLFKQQ